MNRTATLYTTLLGLALGTMFLTGCESDGRGVSAADVWANPTPALHTTARTWAQNQNQTVLSVDHNLRGIYDDMDRILLIEGPSRLSPYRMP